jgi:glycosyltransferase involved in cell wall biosynthesis
VRLLVVGHSYVTPFAQAKYVAMKALCRNLDLRLLVPQIVRHVFAEYRPTLAAGLAAEDLVIAHSFGGRSNMTYALDPVKFATLVLDFKPTHVHIEEDPHSVVGFEATLLARMLCPRAVLSYFLWDNLNHSPSFPLSAIKGALTRFGLSRARLVVCGNRDGQRLLAAKGYHGASEVIPQIGLDVLRPANRRHNRTTWSTGGMPTIGFFGRLVEEKGVLDLLNALKGLMNHQWHLIVAGDGPLRREIESEWQPQFGDRLTLSGPISHADVQASLSSIDVFVLPSYSIPAWKEQFGITLVQAMFAGCACVGSTCGAIPEVLDGRGLVFPERDVPALSAALRRLLDAPAERARLGAAASEFAAFQYSNETIARTYLRAFEAIAN